MNLKILNKANFIHNFLNPVSRINDLCSLTLENNNLYSLNRTSDSNFMLYASTDDFIYEGDKRLLSFADIKKFIKAFECITQDTDIELKLNENTIEYSSHINKFKFHLINDNIVRGPNYSLEKLNSLEFDVEFKLSYASYLNLIKSSTFISSEKIYLSTLDGKVHGELTDKTKSNIDSYSLVVSDSYIGSNLDKPLCFDFNLFRSVSIPKNLESTIRLSNKGIIAFVVEQDKYKLKYISTAHAS